MRPVPAGNGSGYNPPTNNSGSNASQQAAIAPNNIQLVTSTGGLSGSVGMLMTPVYNPVTGKSFIITHNPLNFNCEENTEYDFRQEAVPINGYYEGRDMSIHEVIVKYRELGMASLSINITVFKKLLDAFITIQIPLNIPAIPFNNIKDPNIKKQRQLNFPDGKIHTVRLAPPGGVIIGERPQASVTAYGNSGAYSITKLILCGNADEGPQA